MKFDKLNDLDTFRWERIKDAELEGKYDMPKLQPVHDVEPENLVPFHMAKTAKNPEQRWFHFYEDDYQFERLWNRPAQYLSVLRRFAGGISTDYSIYLDMPRSQQIWNCWRNRATAYYMQRNGLTIIPNAGWSDAESLEWAFDGLPAYSVLSITTQGCMGHDYVSKQSLLNGLHELARQKHPEKLVVYGKFPDAWRERFPMPIVVCNTFSQERWGA
ncbi:MAG: DUF4417 domain-containing protein [Clostridia bacterium]|nr:DUF4417 domain-containing protein [Clostridia bacterium]